MHVGLHNYFLVAKQENNMADNKEMSVKGDNKGMLPLGRDRFLTVSVFQEDTYISVRQYLRYTRKAGPSTLYPSQPGISLSPDSWIDLMAERERITEALKAVVDEDKPDVHCRVHIGRNIMVTVQSCMPFVNIRKWFLPEGEEELVPTRKGICLTQSEWEKVLSHIEDVEELVPQVKDGVPCAFRDDHANQLGFLGCPHCSPNTFKEYAAHEA